MTSEEIADRLVVKKLSIYRVDKDSRGIPDQEEWDMDISFLELESGGELNLSTKELMAKLNEIFCEHEFEDEGSVDGQGEKVLTCKKCKVDFDIAVGE